MAIVTRNGQGYANPISSQSVRAIFAAPRAKGIVSVIPVANGDSISSIYNVGMVPTSAILDPASVVYSSGIAGLTSVSFGFAGPSQPVSRITWAAQPNALANAKDWSAAAALSLLSSVAVGNYSQQVWQLLGLTEDPGGNVGLFSTLNTAATAAGTLTYVVKYFDDK